MQMGLELHTYRHFYWLYLTEWSKKYTAKENNPEQLSQDATGTATYMHT